MSELSVTALMMLGLALALGLVAGVLLGRRGKHAVELRLAAAQASLKSTEEVADERDQALDLALERLRGSFDAMAGQALRGNNELFLQLARQALGQQQELSLRNLTEREKAVESMLDPVRDALRQTQEQIARIEKERAESFGALRASLEHVVLGQASLQRETHNLVSALRRPEVRGQWGELTLKRLAELAGMVEHCDFYEQTTLDTEAGRLRPDMIVRLPDGREIVVDVKTPLDAYLNAVEAADDETRRRHLEHHARKVRERVKELAAKSYWSQFRRAPDFVVLFIPGDQFLAAALDHDRTLLEDALSNRIILTTPTSFVALLRAVAYGWRQEALAANAERIREVGEELYRRLATFAEHLTGVGKGLDRAVESYNRAVGSFETKLVPGARRFTELGVGAVKDLEEPLRIEKKVREVGE